MHLWCPSHFCGGGYRLQAARQEVEVYILRSLWVSFPLSEGIPIFSRHLSLCTMGSYASLSACSCPSVCTSFAIPERNQEIISKLNSHVHWRAHFSSCFFRSIPSSQACTSCLHIFDSHLPFRGKVDLWSCPLHLSDILSVFTSHALCLPTLGRPCLML